MALAAAGTTRTSLWTGDPAFGPLDKVLWAALVAVAMAAAYHPYFFGDEISPLRDAAAAPGFLEALAKISTYKPRMVFNAIWAWGGVHEWPRWAFGAINAASIIGIGAVVAHMASRWFSATRVQVWLLLGTIVLSRFSAMFYFDYVSGIIETLSLLCFLLAVLCSAMSFQQRGWGWLVLAVGFATAAGLVHERYIAGTFALGCAVAGATWLQNWDRRTARQWVLAVTVGLVPAATFLLLVKLMHALPASTGTSGQEVTLGLGTLKVFSMYIGNLFLGFNFGKPWFVGAYTMESTGGRLLALVFGVAFVVAWIGYARSVRHDHRRVLAIIGLLMLIGAMTVMASLPGEGRQEARWMYSPAVLLALMVFCSPRALVRCVLLGLMLALAAVHWGSGALDQTANLYVSRTAKSLADGVNGLAPPGRHALLVGMGNNPWDVGEVTGVHIFSRRNFGIPLEMRIYDPNDPQQRDWADMLIVRSVTDNRQVSRFAMLSGDSMQLLLAPDRVDALRGQAATVVPLGDATRGWEDWRWSTKPREEQGQVILEDPRRLAGFLARPAAQLQGKTLVYRARLLDSAGPGSSMRLQVNWMGAGDTFLSSSIKVVEVGPEAADFAMGVQPPAGAVQALVYANLHDGQSVQVVLESVVLQAPALNMLGQGANWEEWRWQGDPVIDVHGVHLRAAHSLAGYREVSAPLLDNHLLVYRARLKDPAAGSANMRLQVNWHDAQQHYLGSSIDVAKVTAEDANHALFVVAPPHAAMGQVYANLHDGEEREVILESVDVVNPR